jgi:hypothetical protein
MRSSLTGVRTVVAVGGFEAVELCQVRLVVPLESDSRGTGGRDLPAMVKSSITLPFVISSNSRSSSSESLLSS